MLWRVITGFGLSSGLIFVMLSACATDRIAPPPAVVACVPIIGYSSAFEKQAAKQLAALPAESPLSVMIRDYGATRAALRACH